MARRRRPSAEKIPLPAVGEELLELADRAGLDPRHHEDLRKVMSVWARRYKHRTAGTISEDAALVALTVSYLRRYRDEDLDD